MIELRDVSVSYPNHVTALTNVSVYVRAGEFCFVVGPTGAGKSTFLKLLYREEKATSGRVVVAGQDMNVIRPGDIPYFRRRIGIVFQDFGLLPNRTVYENVAFALRVIGAGRTEIRQKVPEALEMVSMAHRPDAFPHQLSGGEQQRVAIARALVNNPPLLLADEPTGNLDPVTSLGIVQLLDHIHQRGTTVIVATHDSAIVDRMQRRVLAFRRGELAGDIAQGLYNEGLAACEEGRPRPEPMSRRPVYASLPEVFREREPQELAHRESEVRSVVTATMPDPKEIAPAISPEPPPHLPETLPPTKPASFRKETAVSSGEKRGHL